MSGKDMGEVLTRHDFWRACYATLLTELPIDKVAEFFRDRPFSMAGARYADAELLKHLWREKALLPMDWNYSAVDALEPFLVRNQVDVHRFMKRLLFRNNHATWMPGKVVLSWFYPIMDKVFRNNDPREMVFHLISVFTEAYLPGHRHRCVKKQVSGDWLESFLVYATHKECKGRIKFNFDLIAGEQIKAAPNAINLPGFEDIEFIADQRDPGDVLQDAAFQVGPEGLSLEGRLVARQRSFHGFLADLGLDPQEVKAPDGPVFEALADLDCPVRKRIVLHKGCAYGAAVYISKLRYRPLGESDRGYLKHLIGDTVTDEDAFGPEILERHLELVRRLEETLTFVYYPHDESMTVNGEHLVRGISAKILRNLVSAYTGQGRNEFEYRDFKRDLEISMGQKNSNFEVRFYRLIERMQMKCPQIRIIRLDRGKFRFDCACRLEFTEDGLKTPAA